MTRRSGAFCLSFKNVHYKTIFQLAVLTAFRRLSGCFGHGGQLINLYIYCFTRPSIGILFLWFFCLQLVTFIFCFSVTVSLKRKRYILSRKPYQRFATDFTSFHLHEFITIHFAYHGGLTTHRNIRANLGLAPHTGRSVSFH